MHRAERDAQLLRIGDRILPPQPLGHACQVRFGLLARHARLQSRQRPQEIHRRAHATPRVGIRSEWNRQFCVSDRKEALRRQDAHHGVAGAIERQCLSHHLRISSEAPLPEAMAQHHDALLSRRVIGGQQGATDHRLHAQHLKGVG